jgi:aldehyde dehydrogenase family 7 protein A1
MAEEKLTFSEYPFLRELGLEEENAGVYNGTWFGAGKVYTTFSPIDNRPIARIRGGTKEDYESCLTAMQDATRMWQSTPGPKRGEIVRQIGEAVRHKKKALGALISLEMGKILKEGEGEVQEFIDICDYSVGLSRIMNGLVLPSERPGHVMYEKWHPLGMIGVITAFNFPVAVSGWNGAISLVCGNTQIWQV